MKVSICWATSTVKPTDLWIVELLSLGLRDCPFLHFLEGAFPLSPRLAFATTVTIDVFLFLLLANRSIIFAARSLPAAPVFRITLEQHANLGGSRDRRRPPDPHLVTRLLTD